MNVTRYLVRSALRHRSRVAIIAGRESISYSELCDRALALGSGLSAMGIGPGSTVALQSANSVHTLEIMFGCWSAGAAIVPIHFKLTEAEVQHILKTSRAALFFHDRKPVRVDGLRAIEIGDAAYKNLVASAGPGSVAEVGSADPAWIFFTSGTTGRPKGATLSHGNLDALILGLLAEIDQIEDGDVLLHAGPMSHASGLCGLAHVQRGSTHVLMPQEGFDPDAVIDLIARHGVTTAFMVPTMIGRLLGAAARRREDLRSLKTLIYGGAPMAVPVIEAATSIFGPVLVQLYGQGEAPHVVSVLSKQEHLPDDSPAWPSRLASAGRPTAGVDVRIVDDHGAPLAPGCDGEIAVRGNIVMTGYWEDPETTARTLIDGWLLTGDVGRIDVNGFLHITDRKKDVIISGGMNVYAREVEDALYQHGAVAEAAVVGIPDTDWGEKVKAVVVLKAGVSATADELDRHCRAHLAPFKKPKIFEFVDELPKGATGKILKRALKTPERTGTAA